MTDAFEPRQVLATLGTGAFAAAALAQDRSAGSTPDGLAAPMAREVPRRAALVKKSGTTPD